MDDTKAVELKNVSYHYPDGIEALKDISLIINKQEKVAIIGPNGAGKSTLITLLNGVRQGTGDIQILGYPLIKKNLPKIRALIGIVFQNPDDQLFCPTIYEDIAFGPLNSGLDADMIKENVLNALKETDLLGYEERSPFHLSFGERKRASIATILSLKPQIIAMDEPTSNLDPAHRRSIISWINKREETFIVTSHDLDMIWDTCSRALILNDGQIVADGSVKEILSDKKLLESNNLELPLRLQK
jgi:cobalt/nickel transport system ATP-binding protein